MYAYWNRLRGERAAPDRGELGLRPLAAILPHMFILERHPLLPRFLFRLAGTDLRRLLCRELTGTDFLAPWPPHDRDAIAGGLGAVVGEQRPCLLRYAGSAAAGRSVGFELIALPLRVAHRNAIHILGAIHPFADPVWLGELPLRFHLEGMHFLDGADASCSSRSLAPAVGLRLIPGGAGSCELD